jgi:hypothetical protein
MEKETQEDFLHKILIRAETIQSPLEIYKLPPKQILPAPLRNLLKIMYLPILLLDLSMQKMAKKIIRPPFEQKGNCKKRGNCCYFILLPESQSFLGKVFYFWQTEINGFFIREKSPPDQDGKKMLIMGCRHLRKDGSCGSYITRPSVCRKWPIIEHFGRPRLLKGCGYHIQLRKKYDKEPYRTFIQKLHD